MKKRVFAFSLVLVVLFSAFAIPAGAVTTNPFFELTDNISDLLSTNEALLDEYVYLTTPVRYLPSGGSSHSYTTASTFSFRDSISSVSVLGVSDNANVPNLITDGSPLYGAKYNSSQGIGALVIGSSFVSWQSFSIDFSSLSSDRNPVFSNGIIYRLSFSMSANSEFFAEQQTYSSDSPSVTVRILGTDFEVYSFGSSIRNNITYYNFDLYFYLPKVSEVYQSATVGTQFDVTNIPLSIDSIHISAQYTDPVTHYDTQPIGNIAFTGYLHAFQFTDFSLSIMRNSSSLTPDAHDFDLGNFDDLSDGLSDRLTDPDSYLLGISGLTTALVWVGGKFSSLFLNVPELHSILLFSLLIGIFPVVFGLVSSLSRGVGSQSRREVYRNSRKGR